MSGKFRCQVVLQRDSAIPADVVVNTWHFDSDQTFAEDADDVAGRLVAFYTAIQGYLSEVIAPTGHQVKVYDMADPTPRSPGHVRDFDLTITAGTPAPSEIALCLSMKAATPSGVSPRRRRGRVYLGPFNASPLVGAQVGGDRIVHLATRTDILAQARTLARGPDPGDGRLAVFSEASAGGALPPGPGQAFTAAQLDAGFNDVVELWIDDRVDVQRRRGAAPTSRAVQALP